MPRLVPLALNCSPLSTSQGVHPAGCTIMCQTQVRPSIHDIVCTCLQPFFWTGQELEMTSTKRSQTGLLPETRKHGRSKCNQLQLLYQLLHCTFGCYVLQGQLAG